MQNLNKKAVSENVVTLLFVLVLVIIATLIFLSLRNIIDRPTLSPEFSCPDLQSGKPIVIKEACQNIKTNEIEVTLERNYAEFDISFLEFTVQSENEESNWICSDSCGNCRILKEGETKTYFFSQENPEKQESVIISYFSCELDRLDITSCPDK